jgi:two-component system NtrC family sensor kinase
VRFQSSIRQKITLGYYGTVGVVVGLSLLTFLELSFLEQKVMFGEIISEFFDTTLEIRRFEKNYVLYEQEQDYRENMKYVEKAGEILASNIDRFRKSASPEGIVTLTDNLNAYKQAMEKYYWHHAKAVRGELSEDFVQKADLEGRIRKIGKDITTRAEEISQTERRNLQIILYKTQRNLIFSLIFLALAAIAIGRVLTRMVVRPLKSLEGSMREIAEGNFGAVSIKSKDLEIVSLADAFNKMLRELELRQRHLVRSEKLASLGTLLSGVAHELNNPLSNISSSTQILSEELGEEDMEYKRTLLSQIEEQTERARVIVRSLLEFSREKAFRKETWPLLKMIEETIRFVKGQVPAKVTISIDIPDDIVIFADKQRIQQAFLNLIKNATESIDVEGEVKIKARKHRAVAKIGEAAELFNYLKYHGKCAIEGDAVDIQIADTGTGMPPGILDRIFDPFFTTKDVGKGSGLGLSIVHEIIEEHGGCIAAESKVGEGTTFFISLPVKE